MKFCPVCMLRQALRRKSDSDEPAPVSGRLEHYELVTDEHGKPIELGRGAMGVTYKAFDVDLRRLVTLKLISERYLGDESARMRFLREARAAASLRHPNVASVFHLGRTNENYFYAMEFVEGETLEKLVKRSGQLEVRLALEIVTQVAAGLAAVHEQKLVHRDIKPSNIMVNLEPGGAVTTKIIDLGLAKSLEEPSAQTAISTPGAFAGTPEFASPEQFAGVPVDIRSDLYSLGVTLWEMVTGQPPFRGAPAKVMYQHQQAPLPLEQLKGVPQPVVVLLEASLEKDPARRLQSPVELLNALRKVIDAVKAHRTVTHQCLREIAQQRLGASGKEIEILPNLRAAIADWRVRLILLSALVIGGGAILARHFFFAPKGATPQVSANSSPAITAPDKSIAVLPFESPSDTKNDTHFADGVQEEAIYQNAILFFDRGLAKEKKWDLDGAMVDYNQAISQFSQLQALNLSSNQPSPLPEAIKLNPNFALAYNNRGNVKSKKGDLDGAMADYNQAIELNPKLAYPYEHRAAVKERKGDLDGAMADHNQAIQLDPKFGLAYRNRGNAKRRKGDFDGAVADFNRAMELGVNFNN
jgi:serine/threonine protein kinase